MKNKSSPLLTALLPLAVAWLTPVHAAVDASGAQEVMKSNKCSTCHAPDKSKAGPSLKNIAAKYKGKANGEDMVIKAITTGPKVKLEDGTQEEHRIIKTKDVAQLKNVAQWILSQ
jgi:cytochrome c